MPLAPRHAARLLAGALLSCTLAAAHAQQSPRPLGPCETRRPSHMQDAPCPAPGKPELREQPIQRECTRLKTAIEESEQAERRAGAAMMESVQQDLAILRQRYKKLGC